jgi:gamma-glutamylcyclotransferase
VSSETHIFAYGSNLDPTRIRTRIPSTRVVGRSWLEKYDLRFHVRGTLDGTAKADAFHTGEATHRVLGMIYAIRRAELPILDRIEGGYSRVLHRLPLDVTDVAGVAGEHKRERMVSAWSYHGRPETIAEGLQPYDWYLDHVVRGARFHAFPGDYLRRLEEIPSISRGP